MSSDKGATIAIFSINGILLMVDAILAFFVLRPHRKRYARESWYLLVLATLFLAVVHGGNTTVAAWQYAHDEDFPHPNFTVAMIFPFAYILCTLGACRTVFWEMTAPAVFKAHNRVRWSLLVPDAMLIVLLAFVSIAASGLEREICFEYEPCTPVSILYALESLSGAASVLVPAMIWFSYCTIASGAFFARKWAIVHGINVSIANAMLRVVVPTLLVQTLFHAIALFFTAWKAKDFDPAARYYASVPFWVQQTVVLGALIWTFRTHPVDREGFVPLAGSVSHSHIELSRPENTDMPSGVGAESTTTLP
ncbi:hypothetical protein AURDEDRAFT_110196 [Auricularia subglabra TFB-10046 SS5]|nr:hypothetical protein AURDEDRAFT_110196 [Auricularia subglabra TFB-10046 SS5]